MSDKKNRDDGLLGGRTPFVSPSEHARILPGHRALRFEIEGKESSRDMNLIICAIQWNIALQMPESCEGVSHEDFMTGFIAGANSDLLALGFPMISIDEVISLAAHPQIVAASKAPSEGKR